MYKDVVMSIELKNILLVSTIELLKLKVNFTIKALWYSECFMRLLHRQSQFDPHSWRFTWQVNEPSPGSTLAL